MPGQYCSNVTSLLTVGVSVECFILMKSVRPQEHQQPLSHRLAVHNQLTLAEQSTWRCVVALLRTIITFQATHNLRSLSDADATCFGLIN